MKLVQLQTFCALIEGGSLDAAAERVRLTQPAVSQHLRALETEFGVELYERRAGKATPAGDRLYRRARALLNAGADLRREMREFDESAEELTVGASDTNALYFLPPYIRTFRNAHARTPLSVVCRPSGAIAEAVSRGEIDVGIVTLPVDAEGLAQRELDEQNLVLITPKKHALLGGKWGSPKRPREEPMVRREAAARTGGAIERFLAEHGILPNVVMRTGSFEVVKRYVTEGIGLSFVPERVLTAAERKSLGVLTVAGLPKLAVGVVWRAAGYQAIGARRFLNVLGVKSEETAAGSPS